MSARPVLILLFTCLASAAAAAPASGQAQITGTPHLLPGLAGKQGKLWLEMFGASPWGLGDRASQSLQVSKLIDSEMPFSVSIIRDGRTLTVLVVCEGGSSAPLEVVQAEDNIRLGTIPVVPFAELRGQVSGADLPSVFDKLWMTTSGALNPYGWKRVVHPHVFENAESRRSPGPFWGGTIDSTGKFRLKAVAGASGKVHLGYRCKADLYAFDTVRTAHLLMLLDSSDAHSQRQDLLAFNIDNYFERHALVFQDEAGLPLEGVEVYQRLRPTQQDFPWLKKSQRVPGRLGEIEARIAGRQIIWSRVATSDGKGNATARALAGCEGFLFRKPGKLVQGARRPATGDSTITMVDSPILLKISGLPRQTAELAIQWGDVVLNHDFGSMRGFLRTSPVLSPAVRAFSDEPGVQVLSLYLCGNYWIHAQVRQENGRLRRFIRAVTVRGPTSVNWNDLKESH